MSFFGIGKSKKGQTSALPAASRDIASSQGEKSFIPTPNGSQALAPREPADRARGPPGSNSNSVNASISSLPEFTSEKQARSRSESDVQGRNRAGATPREADLYPWSSRRINFTTNANPFPRYGAAVNASASKDGMIYMMGGLINGATVKGDLWMLEAGSGNLPCYPIATTAEGPGPRVGHASLLVGNAFIVFGGDTKVEETDILDDTLYLLNTATKQWSRALPAGPRPAGRYGHTLNILGSRIFIFGGQVEGFFFNDMVAFDLNQLQSPNNRWEVLITTDKDGNSSQGPVPPPRTNHTVVTWNEKLYLFGGTDGVKWFNDVWTYDPRTNQWTEMDCIGYIPAAREGHAACLVNDVMYIFGGRVQEGTDLGDLAAFKISTKRWYMFQNMGMSPSPRSGHSMTAFGKHIIVLAGEPSSAPRDPGELSLAYVLDTSKIRYPNETAPTQSTRKYSLSDRSTMSSIPQGRSVAPQTTISEQTSSTSASARGETPTGSRLPRPGASGPPPAQQAPQPRQSTKPLPSSQERSSSQSRTPSGRSESRGYNASIDSTNAAQRDLTSPPTALEKGPASVRYSEEHTQISPTTQGVAAYNQSPSSSRKGSTDDSSAVLATRRGSRTARQQPSLDSSTVMETPRPSVEEALRQPPGMHIDSGVGSSPAMAQNHEELAQELENMKSRNAWLASELSLARKAGYQTNSASSPVMDPRASDVIGDDDRPLIEAMLRMRAELAQVTSTIDANAKAAANKIAEIEKQRDAAIGEAAYAKARLAAHSGSQAGTPQPDHVRNTDTPENERLVEVSRKLASALSTQAQMQTKMEQTLAELQAERRARELAEDTAETAGRRVTDLETNWQNNGAELESLKAELHEAQRIAREEAASSVEARAAARLLGVDKNELVAKHANSLEDIKNHAVVLGALRDAVAASNDKSVLLERKLDEEKQQRESSEQKLSQLRAEHEVRANELEAQSRRLRDTEELAERHAAEARKHRDAVLSGLNRATNMNETLQDVTDERVTVLQQQVESANAMIRSNQEAANAATEKLRRAEERVAGLERYQEQTSRESLAMRKQLQTAVKELQALQQEKSTLYQQLERHQLESNASQVQLKTLKNILDERGLSPADRRSRMVDSPNSQRLGTPEMNRMRELERQLESQVKVHDDMRSGYEQREGELSKEFEEKLGALENEHQRLVKYVRGLEKMLAKMKQELARSKTAENELESQLSQQAQTNPSRREVPGEWERERESMRTEVAEMKENLKTSLTSLEEKISTLESTLQSTEQERDKARKNLDTVQQEQTRLLADHDAHTKRSQAELDRVIHENDLLEERAREAEHKVQLFLDQFETSVDNYRRMSQQPRPPPNGTGPSPTARSHKQHLSIGGESVYSTATDGTDGTEHDEHSASHTTQNAPAASSLSAFPTFSPPVSTPWDGEAVPAASAQAHGHGRDRSSTALDSLANELDALRAHWETSKNHRISAVSGNMGLSPIIDQSPTSATHRA